MKTLLKMSPIVLKAFNTLNINTFDNVIRLQDLVGHLLNP